MTAIDPVCGMEIEEPDAAATSDYQGQTIYFCALGCKEAFDLDPHRYMNAPPRAAAMPSSGPQLDAIRPEAATAVEVAIRARRSVTRFRPDAVPHDAIVRMLEAAVWAPNHHLTEPWEFFVLTGDGRRRFAEIRREFRRTLLAAPDARSSRSSWTKSTGT